MVAQLEMGIVLSLPGLGGRAAGRSRHTLGTS